MKSSLARRSFSLASLLCIAAVAAFASPSAAALVGSIDYTEGRVSITRAGKVIAAPGVGDQILSGDLLETKADGLVTIALAPSSGLGGSITVKPRSALYLAAGVGKKGEPKTSIDLVAGAIASKVKKIAGSPLMQVTTSGTVLGIRGTEYQVAAPLTGAILVACAEGQVWVTDGKAEKPVDAGKAIEKRPSGDFTYLPVAVSSLEEFQAAWIAEEIAAFRAAPLKALTQYEKLYTERSATFARTFELLLKSPVLAKWMEEDRAGITPRPLDPAVMREKKEIVGLLQDIRQNLFVFERIYYRLEEVALLAAGSSWEGATIRKGLIVRDFLRKFAAEREDLSRRVALFRYAESLYAARDQGSPAGGDAFFGSDSGFFGSGGF